MDICFTILCVLAIITGVLAIIVGADENRKPEIIVGAVMAVVGIVSILSLYVWDIPMF